MKVQKRGKSTLQGELVDFDVVKIVNAIEGAMRETIDGVDKNLSLQIAQSIEATCAPKAIVTVEEIQDMVEDALMKSPRPDVAKKYIRYRDIKEKVRELHVREDTPRLLTDRFISRYKHQPSAMSQLGQFTFYRTYSRRVPQENRREYWWETVRRAVEYNCSLVPSTTREEAEELFDNILHLRQFVSGRTFWVGGTPVSKEYPLSNFNCSFTVIDSFRAYEDLFYLLMLGSGVGLRILKEDVAKLPKIRTDLEIIHQQYAPKEKHAREDATALTFSHNTMAKITVGDSKEGWMQSLRYFFQLKTSYEYKNIQCVVIDYNNVRPKGDKLKKFGGTASGHESLKTMFEKIDIVIKKLGTLTGKTKIGLRTIDCMDIANIIAENVVSGGVRRSSEIVLFDSDDQECIDAKSALYKEVDGQWFIDKALTHRQMSNNSIFYESRPTRERLHWQIEKMRYSGEPAWINGEAGGKRRPNMCGVNPCGEILLDKNSNCNLTTINVAAFVLPEGKLDRDGLFKAQRLSARAGYRMTCVELELPHWNETLQRDKLLGCSLTGWQDMVNATGMSREQEIELLEELRVTAHHEANQYAKELGQNRPLLVTTVKPEGTLSLLPTVSSGVHYSHAPFYVRRIRISATDPLVKVCEELKYPVYPEVGQEWDTCRTKVVEFPVKAPSGRTKYDISAIEQLENYKLFMKHYVDHNCSITVHVRNDEWDAVEQWVWDNWDDIVGVSFISLDDSFYKLMPYEAITEAEYEERAQKMRPFVPSLLSKYEIEDESEVDDSDCASGVCPIR